MRLVLWFCHRYNPIRYSSFVVSSVSRPASRSRCRCIRSIPYRAARLAVARSEPAFCTPWIINGDVDVHVTEVATAEPFCQFHRIAVRVAEAIEPCLVIEPDRFDDQLIPFPPADGVGLPLLVELRGPWLRRRRAFEVAHDVYLILRRDNAFDPAGRVVGVRRRLPDARQIGAAIRGSGARAERFGVPSALRGMFFAG